MNNIYSQNEPNGFTYYSTNPQGEKFYYKIESQNDEVIELWIYSDRLINSVNKKSKKTIKSPNGHQVVFAKIYCLKNVYDLLETVVYDKKGNIIVETSQDKYGAKIFPDSSIENLKNKVCN